MVKIVNILFLSIVFLFADTAQNVIKKVEDNLNGKTADMDISMIVYIGSTKRTMKMRSLSIGKEKSFIKILYPRKDEGITFLKIDNIMWQYVPRIERVIKIPASMMLQNWMGSDFTNDDLVKESSISRDYDPKITKEDDTSFDLELYPKENAPVVWGKLIMKVNKQYYLPITVKYYDEDGVLIRILNYKNIKKFGKRYYPTYWEMLPQTKEKQGHKTVMEIDKAVFDKDISSSYFTKNALKRYSR